MAKAKWKPFPHPDKAYVYAGEALKKSWERLHRGDCEPWPKDPRVRCWRSRPARTLSRESPGRRSRR